MAAPVRAVPMRAVACLLTLVLLAPLALAEPRSETRSYATSAWPVGITESVFNGCDTASTGAVCFSLWGDETRVDVRIEDVTGLHVAANIQVHSFAGEILYSATFCDATAVDLPPDSGEVLIVLYDPALAQLVCFGQAGVGGVKGTVTADFS